MRGRPQAITLKLEPYFRRHARNITRARNYRELDNIYEIHTECPRTLSRMTDLMLDLVDLTITR